ncbi:MAG: hypothetical protein DMG93_05970 [Acidobacteria bacterium]|nr:MAG: hypothetical protein DMG93_05970 [Acidobacteriota bacterium]
MSSEDAVIENKNFPFVFQNHPEEDSLLRSATLTELADLRCAKSEARLALQLARLAAPSLPLQDWTGQLKQSSHFFGH